MCRQSCTTVERASLTYQTLLYSIQPKVSSEVCGLLCINDEEKSGVVVDISCVFRIILNSVREGQKASPTFQLAIPVQSSSNPLLATQESYASISLVN